MTISEQCVKAKESALKLQVNDSDTKNKMLSSISRAIIDNTNLILEKNKIDIDNAVLNKKDSAFIDRLTLNPKRVKQMADGVNDLIVLKDPVGKIIAEWTVENGLKIKKISVPLGVIAIIYEARPNVTVDAIALCLKSGNAVVLKGSKDAINSNLIISEVIRKALSDNGLCADAVQFINDVTYESTIEMLHQNTYIDVVIPRGGNKLKDFVIENATMPVIASAGGNCHIYVEKSADLDMATKVIINAKTNRPSTCNAAEQLLIDEAIAKNYIPVISKELIKNGVEIYGCEKCVALNPSIKPASEIDYYTERNNLIITMKVVKDYIEAIERINKYSTKHSEAIISKNDDVVKYFVNGVDSACVYHNASTRFTDGFEFGFGAEMGISTQKLHVRGPIGLEGLTSFKYIIEGNGQIRK